MLFHKTAPLMLAAVAFLQVATQAQNLNTTGVTLLRRMTTNLNGSGIRVAQPEAEVATSPPTWEVDPVNVGQPNLPFSYFSSAGSATAYPNSLGTNSWHAENVGNDFYGLPSGVATNVAHVDNYEANYFYNSVVNAILPSNINDPVVNQSFVFNSSTVSQQQQIDSAYDNYSAQFGTLFVSGAGNGGPVNPPATGYNGIGVGVSDGPSSYGPTLDNGRSKPDIIAPGGETSYSTPLVAGAAALLMQAALRGDGGSDPASGSDPRTVKALLLNGAVKPAGWTNSTAAPLDTLYGAGMLNAFNSYEQLAGGKHGYQATTSVALGGAHPPNGASGTVGVLSGWDFNTNSSSITSDVVNHYYFNVSNGIFTATATLVWNRHQNATGINNLALFLYNAANSNLVTCSTSTVDNVQHLFVPRLVAGRYDLQVWKAGGSHNAIVSSSEAYALAWAFAAPELTAARSGANLTLTWPVYPAGYLVQMTTSLLSAAWSANGLPAANVVNGTNTVSVPMTDGAQFFRLRQPDF